MRLEAALACVLLVAVSTACSPAQDSVAISSTSPSPSTAERTPSTSSADVTVEPSDAGIEAVRAVYDALRANAAGRASELLGEHTREAVRTPAQRRALRDQLAPLVGDDSAPFDDVVVSQTPEQRTHLVVLGDRSSDTVIAAEVIVRGATTTVELSPPVPADITFDIAQRRRIQITTPTAAEVEIVVDGFHFHPTVPPQGPAVMNLPFPLTPRTHVLGAWYRTANGESGVHAEVLRVAAGRGEAQPGASSTPTRR